MENNTDINEVLKHQMDNLKSYLPKKWAETASENTGMSISTVRHAANGRFYNRSVILELIRLAKIEKSKILSTLETQEENGSTRA